MGHGDEQAVVIIGAGPAGLAPLFAAACAGSLGLLLKRGVTLLERGQTIGCGALEAYGISSDSAAEAFLDIVVRTQEPRLAALRTEPAVQTLIALGKNAAPLQAVAAFLRVAGHALCAIVAESERGHVLTGVTAQTVRRIGLSLWETTFVDATSGTIRTIRSRAVILATGAHQPEHRLETELVAGKPLLPRFAHKLLQSHAIMGLGGAERVRARLGHLPRPRVVIVGGSTSAGAVATTLLDHTPGVTFSEDGVTILHRKPLRIFYETPDEARADGYTEFTSSDICRLTGRVYRLSGFRLESRDLLLRARGIGGRPRETRLALLQLAPETNARAEHLLERADLILAAMGYKPRLLPVMDAAGRELPLLTPGPGRWAVVDERCRILNAVGDPLDGLFAIGLSIGPAASEALGGEIGFEGQVNSLWLWQHTLGMRIIEQVLAAAGKSTESSIDEDAPQPRFHVEHHATERHAALRASGRDQP